MSFTERQLRLIEKCKSARYGWAKFAASVEASGHCTSKQEDTLCTMSQRIEHAKARKAGNFKHGMGYGDWDDHNLQAASSGYESNDY